MMQRHGTDDRTTNKNINSTMMSSETQWLAMQAGKSWWSEEKKLTTVRVQPRGYLLCFVCFRRPSWASPRALCAPPALITHHTPSLLCTSQLHPACRQEMDFTFSILDILDYQYAHLDALARISEEGRWLEERGKTGGFWGGFGGAPGGNGV